MTKEQKQYNRVKIVFSTNGAEITEHSDTKKKERKNLDTECIPFTIINSEWMLELNANQNYKAPRDSIEKAYMNLDVTF